MNTHYAYSNFSAQDGYDYGGPPDGYYPINYDFNSYTFNLELGAGWYRRLNERFTMHTYAAPGYQRVGHAYVKSAIRNPSTGYRQVDIAQLAVGANIVLSLKYFEIGANLRGMAANYFAEYDRTPAAQGEYYHEYDLDMIDSKKVYFFGQAGFHIAAGLKNVKIFGEVGRTSSHVSFQLPYDQLFVGAGLRMNLPVDKKNYWF